MTFNFLWLFLTMPCVGLQCVIVVFPEHTHLHFRLSGYKKHGPVYVIMVLHFTL